MRPDSLGFLRPEIDEETCVSCGACNNVCPVLNLRDKDSELYSYWAQAKDRNILLESSSGGVFHLLAMEVLRSGGIVCGAAFTGDFRGVEHRIVEIEGELGELQTSKYVQSTVSAALYRSVERELRAERRVLFVGTGCQVSGMLAYLGVLAKSPLLLAVDVICHGVPSPELWRRYVEHLEQKGNDALSEVNFRSKSSGWRTFSLLCKHGKEKVFSTEHSKDWYMKAFLKNASLRDSCFSCPSKAACGGDLTLGDYWGVSLGEDLVDSNLGVSAVIVRTEKGLLALREVKSSMEWGRTDYADISSHNPALESSVAPYEKRRQFLSDVSTGMSIAHLKRRWAFTSSFIDKVSRRMQGVVREIKRSGRAGTAG